MPPSDAAQRRRAVPPCRYEGRLLLRFDDTNPSKEKGEYEEAIIEDLKRLEITPSSVSHTSDHFEAILKLQTRMLEENLAYVDPSPQEEQKTQRLAKQENKYRSQPVAENMRLWAEMQKASEEGLKCCVRPACVLTTNRPGLAAAPAAHPAAAGATRPALLRACPPEPERGRRPRRLGCRKTVRLRERGCVGLGARVPAPQSPNVAGHAGYAHGHAYAHAWCAGPSRCAPRST